jgi:hypothetical protein
MNTLAYLLLAGNVFPQAFDSATAIRLAPEISPVAIEEAMAAMNCARRSGIGVQAERLAVIDYTKSSREPRMWVFDLRTRKLLYRDHVAHGSGSGADIATEFSDRSGSHQSSLGLYFTGTTYMGGNGYSLRLHGLSGPLNRSAYERSIVIHGADYVNPAASKAMGRIGRSWGCPALRREVAVPIINDLKEGQFVYAFGPGSRAAAECSLPASLVGRPTAGGN